jgi:glutamate N-acetyltransferase/amino-acid N-acetyltransferase
MEDLATMIVKDGEGATKVVQVKIRGAARPRDAETAARVVANSSLVKTAFYGQDPNWGRIMGALGRSGIEMVEEKIGIWINDVQIVANGLGAGADAEHKAAEEMKEESFDLVIDLQQGDHTDRIITCDLTHEYVSINADYRT